MSISTTQARSNADNVAGVMAVESEDTDQITLPPSLSKFVDKPALNNDPLPGASSGGADVYGVKVPLDEETHHAKSVLDGAPTGCTALEVASYYWAVGEGVYGEELRPYVAAWPVRWNPVIVEFFKSTHTTPEGDETAWCAAFINYCLMRGAIERALPSPPTPPTKSARARSFETWGVPTPNPQPGDLVVFENLKSGGGHVAFFLADQGDRVLVLGGNQLNGDPARHSINKKSYTKSGPILKVLGYRTDPQLH
ncbi:CHAP domain-containing protein [Pseudomonas aeruginosa]|uniref:CHAP domain-containing protein n=1 Tax=Pseudomonas aeruginosa TaxID=287 RepID=UPI0008FB714D|nr:CHAP domain-containing protein [Pseudomonas aeruginosa]